MALDPALIEVVRRAAGGRPLSAVLRALIESATAEPAEMRAAIRRAREVA